MTTFGIINLLVAISLAICSFFHVLVGEDPMNFTGLAFIIGGAASIPFIASYTRLGFNEDAESGQEEESKRRKKIISAHYPGIMNPFYFGIALIPISWICHSFVNPFTFFIAVLNAIAAYWCLHVFPKARKLFSPFR
jgi:hypothetical protein